MPVETTTREFPITVFDSVGTLLLTDLALMVRPAPVGQHHAKCPHDVARIIEIMNLGDYNDDAGYTARGFNLVSHEEREC